MKTQAVRQLAIWALPRDGKDVGNTFWYEPREHVAFKSETAHEHYCSNVCWWTLDGPLLLPWTLIFFMRGVWADPMWPGEIYGKEAHFCPSFWCPHPDYLNPTQIAFTEQWKTGIFYPGITANPGPQVCGVCQASYGKDGYSADRLSKERAGPTARAPGSWLLMSACVSGHGAICLPSCRKTKKRRWLLEFLLSRALQHSRQKPGKIIAWFQGVLPLPGVSPLLWS